MVEEGSLTSLGGANIIDFNVTFYLPFSVSFTLFTFPPPLGGR